MAQRVRTACINLNLPGLYQARSSTNQKPRPSKIIEPTVMKAKTSSVGMHFQADRKCPITASAAFWRWRIRPGFSTINACHQPAPF
jgi:hypothetical protein